MEHTFLVRAGSHSKKKLSLRFFRDDFFSFRKKTRSHSAISAKFCQKVSKIFFEEADFCFCCSFTKYFFTNFKKRYLQLLLTKMSSSNAQIALTSLFGTPLTPSAQNDTVIVVPTNNSSNSAGSARGLSPLQAEAEQNVPDQWEGCHPDAVIRLMKAVVEPTDLGTNTKPFFPSYKAWDTLTNLQRNKSLAFFLGLSPDKRVEILNAAKLETIAETAEAARDRAANVHKNDLIRIFHLRKDPTVAIAWSNSEKSLSRMELDGRNSSAYDCSGRGFLSDAADPYSVLATRFNDYRGFCPQNAAIQYIFKDGVSQPMNPFKAISPDLTAIAARVHDMNPTDVTRSNIIRDGAWIKEWWTKLKGYLSSIYLDFDRSGRDKAAQGEAELDWQSETEVCRWVYHSNKPMQTKYPQVITYAYAIMVKEDFETLGKVMEPGTGRDSSVLNSPEGSSAEAHNRRRERVVKTKRSRDDDGRLGLAQVLADAAKALELAVQFGTGSDKIRAQREIMRLAFSGVAATTPASSSSSSSSSSANNRYRGGIAGRNSHDNQDTGNDSDSGSDGEEDHEC